MFGTSWLSKNIPRDSVSRNPLLPPPHETRAADGVPDGDAQQFLYKLHALNCLRTAITVRNALTFSITNVKFTLMPPVCCKHGPICHAGSALAPRGGVVGDVVEVDPAAVVDGVLEPLRQRLGARVARQV